jgi:hypothetical protein
MTLALAGRAKDEDCFRLVERLSSWTTGGAAGEVVVVVGPELNSILCTLHAAIGVWVSS